MKIIKIISAIAMSYFLSGCMTSSLLDTIKTESAPTTEVWKTDEIKSNQTINDHKRRGNVDICW